MEDYNQWLEAELISFCIIILKKEQKYNEIYKNRNLPDFHQLTINYLPSAQKHSYRQQYRSSLFDINGYPCTAVETDVYLNI